DQYRMLPEEQDRDPPTPPTFRLTPSPGNVSLPPYPVFTRRALRRTGSPEPARDSDPPSHLPRPCEGVPRPYPRRGRVTTPVAKASRRKGLDDAPSLLEVDPARPRPQAPGP